MMEQIAKVPEKIAKEKVWEFEFREGLGTEPLYPESFESGFRKLMYETNQLNYRRSGNRPRMSRARKRKKTPHTAVALVPCTEQAKVSTASRRRSLLVYLVSCGLRTMTVRWIMEYILEIYYCTCRLLG